MKIITITKPVFLINVHNPHQVSYDVDILSTSDSENWKLLEAKQFYKKFSKNVSKIYLISQKDVGKEENLMLKPFYLMPFLIK
jgi:hypothetical protein